MSRSCCDRRGKYVLLSLLRSLHVFTLYSLFQPIQSRVVLTLQNEANELKLKTLILKYKCSANYAIIYTTCCMLEARIYTTLIRRGLSSYPRLHMFILILRQHRMKNIWSVCFRSQRTVYVGSRLFRNAKKSPYCFDVSLLTQIV